MFPLIQLDLRFYKKNAIKKNCIQIGVFDILHIFRIKTTKFNGIQQIQTTIATKTYEFSIFQSLFLIFDIDNRFHV